METTTFPLASRLDRRLAFLYPTARYATARSALLVGLMALSPDPARADTRLAGDLPRRADRPLESTAGLTTRYDVLVAPDGSRLRTIVTRPRGTPDGARLPGLLFVQWLSCDSVELSDSPADGWSRMLRGVFGSSGYVGWRTDKAGVGDSAGTACAELDYDTELSHHRAALRALRREPGVDPDRIVVFGASMGATMAPLLANEPGVAGVVVWGGGARTWFERTLAFERRRRENDGTPGGRAGAEMKEIAELLAAYLLRSRTPAQITAEDPRLGGVFAKLTGVEDGLQYGRSAAFHQQAQRQDWAGVWERVAVPTLVLFGENDWYEDPEGPAWIAEQVNRSRPGLARFRLLPGLDHHFERFGTLAASVRGEGGTVDEGPAVAQIVSFLRSLPGDLAAPVQPE